MRSWLPVPDGTDFPLENLPYGAFIRDGAPHLGVAIGDNIFDLCAASELGVLHSIGPELARAAVLNPLLAEGRETWSALRAELSDLLREGTRSLDTVERDNLVVPRKSATMVTAFACGDYVDFYSSLEHATNLGKILRPGGEPLLPNWRSLPIGYHGRCSTLVIDGTPIVRPAGQRAVEGGIRFGPTRSLDFELEVGFLIGPGNAMGTRIEASHARDHIFGLVLVNDWSARDIQAWEYQPLGPFLGKSFATSLSPWVVTLEALEPYRVAGPPQEPEPLPYLRCTEKWNYDIDLSVEICSRAMRAAGTGAATVSRTNFRHMYWNPAQQLAHLTSNGTSVRPGDLCASGTVSGPQAQSAGSLIELTWKGERPLALTADEPRTFLEDGDCVTLRGAARRTGRAAIGFGSVSGTILPALP